MKISRGSKIAVVLAALAQVLPCQATSAAPTSTPPAAPSLRSATVIGDVTLRPDGRLQGIVVDASGLPLPNIRVDVTQSSSLIAYSVSNERGQFTVPITRGGVYQIEAGGSFVVCRLWSAPAAPPSAPPELLIVAGGATLRGQAGMYNWISEHPWCFYTVLATAIVVPVVIISSNHDDDSSS